MTDYDLVIAGAGLAGCASAILLSELRPQSRILVVERREQARSFSGEYLDPEGVSLWRSLGLPELSGTQSHGVVWHRSDGTTRRHAFSSGAALCLDWAEVVAALEGELFSCESPVAVARGTRIKACGSPAEGWSLTLAKGDHRTTITTRFLIDATGRAAALGRRLGSRREVLWANQSASHTVDAPVPCADLMVKWRPDGWLMAHPLPERGWMARLVTDAAHPNLEAALRAWSQCAGWDGSLPVEPACIAKADTSRLVPAGGAGWLAVGDAGWALDPLSGKGMTEALRSAFQAARVVAGILDGTSADQALAGYLKDREQRFREMVNLCWQAYRLLDPDPGRTVQVEKVQVEKVQVQKERVAGVCSPQPGVPGKEKTWRASFAREVTRP